MEPREIIVKVDKYTFTIKDNILSYNEQIYSRNFKIGGKNIHCVDISITYNENKPVSASIPHIFYDQECTNDVPLEKGNGSIIMIKTLLKHVYKEIPSLKYIDFEDKSNIECATEEEIIKKSSRFKKRGTHVIPVPLYYFSIAFNGLTWYEKHFNAIQKNQEKHKSYRERINFLLYEKEAKMEFINFLQIAQPPMEIVDELEKYYENSNTFGDFFESMPKSKRCYLVKGWIENFMSNQLKDVFSNENWIIPLGETTIFLGGIKNRRKTKKYYYPNSKINYNTSYRDFGIIPDDI